jgi:hypothetical protein
MIPLHKFLWVPLGATAAAAFVSAREGYLRVYYTVHFLDKSRGIDHEHASVDRFRMRAGGVAAAVATGAVTYVLFRRALFSILLSSRPRPDRLFDSLGAAELPPPLNAARVWALFNPWTAPRDNLAQLRAVHGAQAFSMFVAAAWAALIAPFAHARAESALAFAVSPNDIPGGVWGPRQRALALQREAARLGMLAPPADGAPSTPSPAEFRGMEAAVGSTSAGGSVFAARKGSAAAALGGAGEG